MRKVLMLSILLLSMIVYAGLFTERIRAFEKIALRCRRNFVYTRKLYNVIGEVKGLVTYIPIDQDVFEEAYKNLTIPLTINGISHGDMSHLNGALVIKFLEGEGPFRIEGDVSITGLSWGIYSDGRHVIESSPEIFLLTDDYYVKIDNQSMKELGNHSGFYVLTDRKTLVLLIFDRNLSEGDHTVVLRTPTNDITWKIRRDSAMYRRFKKFMKTIIF